MESEDIDPGAVAAALAAADDDRDRLTAKLALPTMFFSSLAVAITAQLATSAVGIARGGLWLTVALPAGLVALAVVALVQLDRFRRSNGVWVNGLASQVVAGSANAASIPYAAAFALATWAALGEFWWLTAVSAIAGGVAYALAGREWWRRYRLDPAAHARGESLVWVAALVVVAAAGLVVVAVSR